ncbi:MAG: M36 family metallopeptidase, partial [Ferruginibacter sp.]
MKKIFLIVLSFGVVFNLFSQTIDVAKTKEIVSKYSKQLALSENDIKDYIVSSSYKNEGVHYIYLVQSFKGLPVRNQMKVISISGNELSSNVGNFIPNISMLTNAAAEIPSLNAKDAVFAAFESEKIERPFLANSFQTSSAKFDFGQLNGVTENVTGELMWYPLLNNDKVVAVKLIWAVVVAPKGTDDVWQIILDANNGHVIDKFNLSISESFTPVKSNSSDNNKSINQLYNNYVEHDAEKSASPSAVVGASYLVVPYPAESPAHAGGTAAIRTNPWSAAVGTASTFGWHSNGTTDYDITRGNNVWATEGTADASTTYGNIGNPATSTTGPDPLTFNFTPNYNSNPTSNPFQQFALTNLFYWNNVVHDISYQYGFNEVSGNFQQNNQGLGGNGNDHVIAVAQSAASGPVGNNANFSTPVDGGRPRMRMYLFNSATPPNVHVNTPSTIGPDFTSVESGFSTANKLANTGPITGQVVYFNDDATGSTHFACGAPANSITGKIVLIDRGNGGICASPSGVSFITKVLAAQSAGAIAVIVINNVASPPIVMAGGPDNTIVIPAVMVSQSDGAILVGQLGNNLNVTLSGGPSLDGDLDNGVIVHEFGHGISNRLTGGPANSSCLQNAEHGGEGWSDYLGLMLTTDWANVPLTDGVRPRPIGTYLLGQSPVTGGGFRNFLYSTNFAVNSLTYANVGTGIIGTGVHNIGEVWCMAIWEMTWAIIAQENAINPNLYNFTTATTGGNSIALKLVLEGMKLQPCSPGFINARDAILAADRNLYAGRHACSIWTAFAKRGMGYSASQGSSASATDQTAATDLPPAPTINTQPTDITVAATASATFTANAGTDVNLIYNWQVSIDGGTTWNNVSPATITPNLTLNAVTSGMSGNKYRAQVFIGCAITTTSVVTLTVTGGSAPALTLTSSAGTNSQTVCINAPITVISYTTAGGVTGATVTGLPTGVTGAYNAGVFTITGSPTATGAFSYTVTTSGNTPNAVATGTITVSAASTLTLTSAAATTSQTVTVNSAVTNITYSTSGGVTGATVTGLPAGVTGTYSGGTNGTITISGTPTAAGNLTYTVTTSGGCGVKTAIGTITSVNGPSITLTSPAGTNAQSVCVSTAINNIIYTAAGGVTGGTVTGLPTGVTGTYSGGTDGIFTIAGSPTVTGTFAYTVTTSGGTSVATVTGTITVNGAVTLTLTSAAATTTQTVNINTAITNITYSSTGGVTGATVTGLPTGVTGVYAGGTNGNVTISGTATAAGTFNYTVATTGGCGTQSRTGTITVVIPPSITLTSSTGSNAQTICIGNSIAAITYASAGGVTGATTTGLPAGVVGTYSGSTNGTYTITGTPTATGTFNYTVTTTGGVATATGSITVNALPAAPTVTTPVIYCQGATATALTATGFNLLWYTAPTGGTGSAMLVPTTTTVGSTTYYVSQTTGTCEGPRASIVVTVNATPAAPVVTTPVSYCQGA